ncbi:MAG: choice-of-anchor V domain-containing protein, partial [Steroidobacteraceae bacterium]
VRPSARAFAALAIALFAAPALLALRFRDGPPARVTGGFGEDSCAACHFGNPLNEGAGKLTLAGFPERFEPGRTYALELTLERPGMKAAGFQLAIRQADGKMQAGRIEVAQSDEPSIALLEERGVQFVHQRTPAAPAAGESAVRWRLSWTAPESGGPATLHAAAVAGDGDESQAGDFVYTLERMAD